MAMLELDTAAGIVASPGQSDAVRSAHLSPGTRVEVRRRFDDQWSRGFEILEPTGDAYRLRRLSDGTALPVPFAVDDVRPERRTRTW